MKESEKKGIKIYGSKEQTENFKAAAEWWRKKDRELMYSKKTKMGLHRIKIGNGTIITGDEGFAAFNKAFKDEVDKQLQELHDDEQPED